MTCTHNAIAFNRVGIAPRFAYERGPLGTRLNYIEGCVGEKTRQFPVMNLNK